MSDLVEWLRVRLDEDEQAAQAAESARWHAKEPDTLGCRVVSISHEVGQVTASILGGNALHIARHDPARVLAEVDAKRRLLDLHPHRRFAALPDEWPGHWKATLKQAFPGTAEPYVGCERDSFNTNYEVVEPDWWCETVRLLALPYAGRPGYREEWRP